MEVVPLHKHKKLTDACADILNSHWPRSKAARSHAFSKSCDQLPVCLAFIQQDGGLEKVLGFSKLSAVQGISNACLVESVINNMHYEEYLIYHDMNRSFVVIHPSLVIVREADRGKGLGKVLMKLTEDYAQRLGMKAVYLTTIDKEGFYARIGYVRCSPVISLGDNAHRVPEALLKKLLGTSNSSLDTVSCPLEGRDHQPQSIKPALLQNTRRSDTIAACPSEQPLVGITPPAPPPPPTNNCPRSTVPPGSYSQAVMRMDPNCIVWMKKDLLQSCFQPE